ncbi:MAG: hypothetical protein ACRD2Y_04760 [Terriglobales bacterium]
MKTDNTRDDGQLGVGQKLDTVIRLLTGILTKGSNKTDAILALDGIGLTPKLIADAVGVSAHHVSQTIYAAKKAGRKALATKSPKVRYRQEDKDE